MQTKKKRIVFFGIGGVGKASLWLLDKFLDFDPSQVTMVDLLDHRGHPVVKELIDRGATYLQEDISRDEYAIVERLLRPYDVLIDLTDNTDSVKIFELTRRVNCHYINTSIEEPKNYDRLVQEGEQEFKTTYQFGHNQINEAGQHYPDSDATSVLEFGANPGLISHFAKHALLAIAKNLPRKSQSLKTYIKEKRYNSLARELQVDTIHVSETDTTEFLDKGRKEFCNTWCCNGLLSEFHWVAEFGWGSHEKKLPKGAELVNDLTIDTNRRSRDLYVESYVPGERFIGCVISHGEGLSLSSYLKDGEYAPTVHYAYKFSPIAWRSVKRLGDKDSATYRHVVNNLDDHIEGTDTLGALLLMRGGREAFWCGSILDNDPKRTGYFQGTLIQVASSVLSCLVWMLKNPKKGWMFPEEVDTEFVLQLSLPYLGRFYCDYVDYKPQSTQFTRLMRTKRQFDAQF